MSATIPTKTYSAADTAAILRARLGPIRAWPDFLCDNIRDKQHVHGHTLLPCASVWVRGHFRPVYSSQDIAAFVDAVLKAEPAAGREALTPLTLAIDPRKPWRWNRFDSRGNPAAYALTMAAA